MRKSKLTETPEPLGVFDLNMACAYYSCVFDAQLEVESSDTDTRKMRIGQNRYHLVHEKQIAKDAPAHNVQVADVDLSVARVVTRGGKILSHPDTADDGHRVGRVRDPFGHLWIVTGP